LGLLPNGKRKDRTSIIFIDFLRKRNENVSVFNLKTLFLQRGLPLADFCSMAVSKVGKAKFKHEEVIHDMWPQSVFNSGALSLKKLR
jgi:hypothetical protein